MTGKQYCVLVHGTWGYDNEPASNRRPWYALDSDFSSKLSQLLSSGENPAVWEIRNFVWPECDNTDSDRIAAAARLRIEIERIRRDDPDGTIHFVTHSHGGNVVLEAISVWLMSLKREGSDAFESTLKQVDQQRTHLSRQEHENQRRRLSEPTKSSRRRHHPANCDSDCMRRWLA